MELCLYLCGWVFGQSHICSIISCLIIGAIFGSEDRALFVLPNITLTAIIFTVIKLFSIIIAVSALKIAWTLESTRASLSTPLSYYLWGISQHFIWEWWVRWRAGWSHIVRQLTVSPSWHRTSRRTIDNWTRTQYKRGGLLPLPSLTKVNLIKC